MLYPMSVTPGRVLAGVVGPALVFKLARLGLLIWCLKVWVYALVSRVQDLGRGGFDAMRCDATD